MERSPAGSARAAADASEPPAYYYHQQQQQQPPFQQQPLRADQSGSATRAKTPSTSTAASASSFAYPLHVAASPNVMAPPPPPPPLDDDMGHWLVDICAQLGTTEDEPQPVPAPAQQQEAVHNASYIPAAPVPAPMMMQMPSLLQPQPTALAVPPLNMQYAVQEYAAYTAVSSSSSPGSSSVDSGGEASSMTLSAFAPGSASNSNSSSATSSTRRARLKKKATSASARAAASTASRRQSHDSLDGDDIDACDGSESSSHTPTTTAEARREKNRLRVRRHYYRKLSQMNDLRAQVSELEEKIQGLRIQGANGGSRFAAAAPPMLLAAGDASAMTDGPVVLSPQQHQMEQFLRQLTDTKHVLEQENQQVREVLYQQTRQFMLSREYLIDESKFLSTAFPMPFIVKKRLASSECDRIWQNTQHELSGLMCHRDVIDGGDSICGWKTTRAVEDGAFKFVFQKMLFNCTAEQTLDASWAIFRDPQGFAKLYSPTVKMWCSLVQEVDADNVVLFQEHRSMDKDEVHVMMKTILLASRVKRHANGADGSQADYSITLRGLEHEQLLLEDLSVSAREGYEVWNDINCWLEWIPRGENNEHCECKVSGAIPTVGSNSYFWMVEVLLIVMRLEATTSGPSLFNVQS